MGVGPTMQRLYLHINSGQPCFLCQICCPNQMWRCGVRRKGEGVPHRANTDHLINSYFVVVSKLLYRSCNLRKPSKRPRFNSNIKQHTHSIYKSHSFADKIIYKMQSNSIFYPICCAKSTQAVSLEGGLPASPSSYVTIIRCFHSFEHIDQTL